MTTRPQASAIAMNNRYFQTPPVVLNLLIINALIFMATALLPVVID